MPGLARGLGSLIPQKNSLTSQVLPQTRDGYQEVEVSAIIANPYQPRSHFSASEMEDLMASVKEHGILQPLVLTRKGNGFELVAGERRLRAAQGLGLRTVPAIIRTASEQQKLEIALIENIQRQQLNALEEAMAYRALMDEFNITQQDVSNRVGKSRSEVANTVRLLDLPEEAQAALRDGKISRSHARTLLAETNQTKQLALLQAMLSGTMTVRDAEASVYPNPKRTKVVAHDPNVAAHEKRLREILCTKVLINERKGSGNIAIYFYSKAELLDLLDKLSSV